MPAIIPVSDFRADIESVGRKTDAGEVVILTQNGRPRWAMVDYDEWNEASLQRELSFARSIRETERRELSGEMGTVEFDEVLAGIEARRAARAAARR